jgi:hypothetical protein
MDKKNNELHDPKLVPIKATVDNWMNSNQSFGTEFGKENTFDQIKKVPTNDQKRTEKERGIAENVEFGEEFAKKNNSNNEQSAELKTAARKDDNVKKTKKNNE